MTMLSPLRRTIRHTRFEATMLFRQRTTLLTVVGVPVALIGLALITGPAGPDGWSALLASWLVLVSAFSLLFAVPAALSSRRENLLFKQLRTSELAPAQILSTLLVPFYAIGVGQGLLVMGAFLALGAPTPQHPLLLALVVLGCPAVAVALGVALGALSSSAEQSQWTVFPVLLAAAVAANFLLSPTVTDGWRQLLLLLPLASFVDLGARGSGLAGQYLVPLPDPVGWAPALVVDLGVQAVWVLAAVLVARRLWRWEPRG